MAMNDPIDPEAEKPIDGGEVIDAVPQAVEAKPSHRERTASIFAMTLLGIFGGTFVLHYVALLIVICLGKDSGVEVINRQFGAWLPVLSGLVGSAATYYLTRNK